jgi:hypothetical protein
MKTTLLLLTLAAACLTSAAQTTPSRAPVVPGNPDRIDFVRFGQFDTNKDGKITADESKPPQK